MSEYRINTKCVQAGYEPKNGESRVVPIVQSTTFKYDSADTLGRLFDLEESGYFYTRLANPTVDTVAKKIAALEGGVGAVLTSSGQAASMMSVTNICHSGDLSLIHIWHQRPKSAVSSRKGSAAGGGRNHQNHHLPYD